MIKIRGLPQEMTRDESSMGEYVFCSNSFCTHFPLVHDHASSKRLMKLLQGSGCGASGLRHADDGRPKGRLFRASFDGQKRVIEHNYHQTIMEK